MRKIKIEEENRRAFAVQILGIVMLVVAAFVMIVGPLKLTNRRNRCAEFVEGEVVSVENQDVQIAYALPGGEARTELRRGTGRTAGETVRVFYNPDDPSEWYIEGFDGSLSDYFLIGGVLVLAGVSCMLAAWRDRRDNAIDAMYRDADER